MNSSVISHLTGGVADGVVPKDVAPEDSQPDVVQRQRLGSVVGGEFAAVVRGDEDPERANTLLQQREATTDSERT